MVSATHPRRRLPGRRHRRRRLLGAGLAALLGVVSLPACAPAPSEPEAASPPSPAGGGAPLELPAYARLLERHVDGRGRVDYAALRADRRDLDRAAARISAVTAEQFGAWGEAAQIAYLINAYNVLTLVSVVDRYPVGSIRDIPGVWRWRRFPVAGRPRTLDAIEHEMLRVDYNEPRLHMAVNCASVGCPVLREEPYRAGDLDRQLNDQVRRMLRDPAQFRLDEARNTVHVSRVFDWFGEDFERSHGEAAPYAGMDARQTAILNFLASHLPEDRAGRLRRGELTLAFLDWDWSLNEQPRPSGG